MNLFILLKQQHREQHQGLMMQPAAHLNIQIRVSTRVDLVMQMHPEAVRLLIRATSSDATSSGAMAEQQLNRIRNVYSIECCSYLIHNAHSALPL
jgi:hypothetical protein